MDPAMTSLTGATTSTDTETVVTEGQLCIFHVKGHCRDGDACVLVHADPDSVCDDFGFDGFCPAGKDCGAKVHVAFMACATSTEPDLTEDERCRQRTKYNAWCNDCRAAYNAKLKRQKYEQDRLVSNSQPPHTEEETTHFVRSAFGTAHTSNDRFHSNHHHASHKPGQDWRDSKQISRETNQPTDRTWRRRADDCAPSSSTTAYSSTSSATRTYHPHRVDNKQQTRGGGEVSGQRLQPFHRSKKDDNMPWQRVPIRGKKTSTQSSPFLSRSNKATSSVAQSSSQRSTTHHHPPGGLRSEAAATNSNPWALLSGTLSPNNSAHGNVTSSAVIQRPGQFVGSWAEATAEEERANKRF